MSFAITNQERVALWCRPESSKICHESLRADALFVQTGEATVAPDFYQEHVAPSGSTGPVFQLQPGEQLGVALTYRIDSDDAAGACYMQDGTCFTVSDCWLGCGAGSRPLLRLSR